MRQQEQHVDVVGQQIEQVCVNADRQFGPIRLNVLVRKAKMQIDAARRDGDGLFQKGGEFVVVAAAVGGLDLLQQGREVGRVAVDHWSPRS
ncbi:MAG: hypothetical protein LUE17_14395 [Planctomycetaceae bacterium]|nr:hypothetical protein [Planctomycetaceae bacterium]